MKYLFIFSVTIAMVFSACEKIIDINIPPQDLKLVVNGLARMDSTKLEVNISKSLSILELDDNLQQINNAHVVLKENNNAIGQMQSQGNGNYMLSNLAFNPNSTYSLEIIHPQLKSAQAKFRFPAKPVFTITDTAYIMKTEYGYTRSIFRIDMEIDDPANERNYYRVNVGFKYNSYYLNEYGDTIWNIGNNKLPLFQDEQSSMVSSSTDFGTLVFADDFFDGKKHRMYIDVDSDLMMYPDSTPVSVTLERITEDFYKYEITLTNYLANRDGIMVQPVLVHNNIENGFGIVGAMSQKDSTFIIRTFNDFKNTQKIRH